MALRPRRAFRWAVRSIGPRLRALSWIACSTLAIHCGSDDENQAAQKPTDGGSDAGTDADASQQADSSADRDPPPPPDGPPGFDSPPPLDGGDAGDGGVIDDDSTPCRDFATLADRVAFAPNATRFLAASELGATIISPDDWSVIRTYAGHRGRIVDAAISANGERGASVGEDGELRMWDASTGRTVGRRTLDKPAHVVFTDGGAAVVVADATGVRAFDWGGTRELWSTQRDAATDPAFVASNSAGGRLLVTGAAGGLDLLDASTGTLVVHLDGNVGAFSPDDTRLVTADGTAVRVFNAAEPARSPATLPAPFAPVAIATASEWIAVSGRSGLDYVTHLLRVSDGAIFQTFRTSYEAATLSPSPDGGRIAAGAGELYVFDVVSGAIAYANRRRGMIWDQSLSTVDPLVAFDRVGGDTEIWDLATGRRRQLITRQPTGNQGTVAFHENGTLLVNHDDTARYWQPGVAAPVLTFTYESAGRQPDERGPMVFSADGELLAGPGDWTAAGNLRIWNANDGRLVREGPAHPESLEALAWSPDGSLIATAGLEQSAADAGDAGSPSRVVKLWNAADGALARQLRGHEDIVSSVVFSPDGALLATADRDGRVRLWSPATGALIRELSAPPTATGLTVDSFNGSVAFSPDGELLASRAVHWIETGHSVYIAIYRVDDGTIVRELRGFGDGNLGAIGWSPDGRYLVGGAGPELRVWCMMPEAGTPGDATVQ